MQPFECVQWKSRNNVQLAICYNLLYVISAEYKIIAQIKPE